MNILTAASSIAPATVTRLRNDHNGPGNDEVRLYSQATYSLPLHPVKLVPEGIGEPLFKKMSVQSLF